MSRENPDSRSKATRWLLPPIILAASALLALGIAVFGGVASEEVVDCSGALSSDFACHQQRYQSLVRSSGVEAAFSDLEDEYSENGFVRYNCHQLVHVIGRAAAGRYSGDVPAAYARGDGFCGSGYYHGVMQAVVAEIGADQILEEADTLCADLRERQEHSLYHRDCAHGLGHGFMGVLENELFDSLEACDALADGWDADQCYGGVFMENVMTMDDPNHPSKYLKADQPLYPCTDVETRHKNECYKHQTSYALYTQNDDYAEVFDLCARVEDGFRPACYQGLGGSAAAHNIKYVTGDRAKAEATRRLCMLSQNPEARSNCVIGAVRNFIHYYNSDEQARALCETFEETSLRAACFERIRDENFA